MESEYRKIAPNVYRKWNPLTQIRTTITYFWEAGVKKMHVRHDQPKQFIQTVLDSNVDMQNSFKGYKHDIITQTTRLPIAVHAQIMDQCGFKAGQGYDEKKFKQILNDRDNYKLKTVPGVL